MRRRRNSWCPWCERAHWKPWIFMPIYRREVDGELLYVLVCRLCETGREAS